MLLQEAKTIWHDAASHPSPTSDISFAFRAAALLKDADRLLLHQSSAATSSAADTASAAPKANGHASVVDMSRASQIPQVIIEILLPAGPPLIVTLPHCRLIVSVIRCILRHVDRSSFAFMRDHMDL